MRDGLGPLWPLSGAVRVAQQGLSDIAPACCESMGRMREAGLRMSDQRQGLDQGAVRVGGEDGGPRSETAWPVLSRCLALTG